MKHFLRLALLLILAGTQAKTATASGGPDAYGYTWITSLDVGGPAFSWIDISSRPGVQTVTGLADDNSAAGMVNLGFSFHYYWSDYTQLKVGSNGWLSFNTTNNIASCFPTIPSAGGPSDNYLAALMSDLNFTGTGNPGQVKYWTNNVDSFIISYIDVPYWVVNAPGWAGPNDFQVILCAGDSSIKFQYGTLATFTNNAACVDMTVGIENTTGSIGLQVHTDAMPPSNYVIWFHPPNVPLISIQDVLPQWNINSANAGEIIVQSAPSTLNSNIRNAGNANVTTTINLQATVRNTANTVVYSSSGSIPTMTAGDDSLFSFAPAWSPVTNGLYSFEVITTNSQDVNAGNNTTRSELQVVNACSPTMLLSFVTGNVPDGSLNWNGGANDDGAAVYFKPPVYPYTVTALDYYISSNVSDGFIARIYDDDGPNGTAGTQLFTTTVSSGILTNNWNTVAVNPGVTLTSGGFYVAWFQTGTTIFLGTQSLTPFSRRNFEILDGSWAEYRENSIEDLCIRATIGNYASVPTVGYTSLATGLMSFDFTGSVSGLATSWSWDFGDGNTSTQLNPSHTYLNEGSYNVCFIASSPCGADTFCQTVTTCISPVAAFSSSASQTTVTFSDASTNSPSGWFWDFGDGNTSTQQNPVHTYSAGGTYNVCLIASSCRNDTICQTVTVCLPASAGFSSSDTLGAASFSDQTVGSPTSWFWDFGDGNTSTLQNPSHTYAATGTYIVCLIVNDSCGADTTCQSIDVCVPATAAYMYTDVFGTVTFADQTGGSPTSWFWDFGDGNNSTAQNPVHTYSASGMYTVCLTISDSCGNDSTCQMINVVITSLADANAGIGAIYPNPANELLNVQLQQSMQNGQLSVIDALGRVVLAKSQLSGTLVQISLENLQPGIYLLRLQENGKVSQIRFVKE